LSPATRVCASGGSTRPPSASNFSTVAFATILWDIGSRPREVPAHVNRFAAIALALAALLAGVALPGYGTEFHYQDHFITVNGVRLQYGDWGGRGEALLFLTELGGTAKGFDSIAERFTDHFHVLALTRRGQGESEKPPSGYDVATLAEDVRAFLDALRIKRVNLVGYSTAGNEETYLATVYPRRIAKLIYLDAAYDYASAQDLFERVGAQFSLKPLKLDDPFLDKIVDGSKKFRPEYRKVMAPALSFHVVYASDYVPAFPAWDEATRRNLQAYWREYGNAFQREQMERFRNEVPRGRVVELHDTSHTEFLTDPKQQSLVIREMRDFLTGKR
jgi:pimeloyl-ACP methyl ester carboxylesterase